MTVPTHGDSRSTKRTMRHATTALNRHIRLVTAALSSLLNAGAAKTWDIKPNTATSSTRIRMRARDAVLHSAAKTAKQVIRQMVFSA